MQMVQQALATDLIARLSGKVARATAFSSHTSCSSALRQSTNTSPLAVVPVACWRA
jgi:hypothetical protein